MKNRIRWILICGCVWLLSACHAKEEMLLTEYQLNEGNSQTVLMEEDNREQNSSAAGDCTLDDKLQERVVVVHVCGAVEKPGVYELPESSRVSDAVEMAGGFSKEANRDYLNLAEAIADGQKIYVPTYEEADAFVLTQDDADTGKININTATKEQLMTLPGIGESKALSILSYREEHGRFSSIEEIMEIPGIKDAIFSKIKEYITVS